MSETLRGVSSRHSPARWSSSVVFVLAAGGATIGFNNFWSFPAEWVRGGAGFLFAYLAGIALVALPLLATQLALGRRARAAPLHAFQRLAQQAHADSHWHLLGVLCLVTCFLVLSYLLVFAGWSLAYLVRALLGAFAGQTADGLGSLFTALVRDPEKQLFWYTLFVAGVFSISARGQRHGLERFSGFAMSWLPILAVFLLAFSVTTPAFSQALVRLFVPGLPDMSFGLLFSGMGHAFFSLLLGFGVMMNYGAHMPERLSPVRAALGIIAIDAGSAVFLSVITLALLESGDVPIASGPAMVFQAVPLALDHISLGTLVTPVFFYALVLVAGLSAVALAEPLVAALAESRGLSRPRAALYVGIAAWVGGGIMMLSFSHWAFRFSLFGNVKTFGVFDLTQWFTTNLLLPVTGLLIAVFAGWVMKPVWHRSDLGLHTPRERSVWRWLLRVVVPLTLVAVMFRLSEVFA